MFVQPESSMFAKRPYINLLGNTSGVAIDAELFSCRLLLFPSITSLLIQIESFDCTRLLCN